MSEDTIILVDDDLSLLRVMQHHLAEAGYNVDTYTNGYEALEAQNNHPAKVIFTDLKMPGMTGIEFMEAVREFDNNVVIIVITGFPSIDKAVDTMKAGAFDFIQKPVDKKRLLTITQKALHFYNLESENVRLRSLIAEQFDFSNMIGNSRVMQKIYEQAHQVATSIATVLIMGETGTGKEMLAKAIHQNSQRKDKAFVTVNCAAVPSTLLESELFGHVKGAFTGAISSRKGLIEKAEGGTLFLDEIGDLPLELQPKLLRVLQEREIQIVGTNTTIKVNVRIIVATHRPLDKMVENNEFREDLYFRLNVIPFTMPPIRERIEDILPLFKHFLSEAAQDENKNIPIIGKEVITRLESYPWPGNVREIRNLAQRLMVLHNDKTIEAHDLPEGFNKTAQNLSIFPDMLPETGIDLEEWIDRLVLKALEKNQWNQSQTARFLRISRNSLIYRMEKRPLIKNARDKLS